MAGCVFPRFGIHWSSTLGPPMLSSWAYAGLTLHRCVGHGLHAVDELLTPSSSTHLDVPLILRYGSGLLRLAYSGEIFCAEVVACIFHGHHHLSFTTSFKSEGSKTISPALTAIGPLSFGNTLDRLHRRRFTRYLALVHRAGDIPA